MSRELEIHHDDDLSEVIDKVNECLAEVGWQFVDDGLEYDGFTIHRFEKTKIWLYDASS